MVASSAVKEQPVQDVEPQVREYWCGTTEDSPIVNACLGGFSFPRWTHQRQHTVKAGMDELSGPIPGNILSLTPEDVKRVMEGASVRVVRWGQEETIQDVNPDGSVVTKAVRRGRVIRVTDKDVLTADQIAERKQFGIITPQVRRMPGDIPFGCYIYMQPVDELPRGFIPGVSKGFEPKRLMPLPNEKEK
jgi:hypothetical protein